MVEINHPWKLNPVKVSRYTVCLSLQHPAIPYCTVLPVHYSTPYPFLCNIYVVTLFSNVPWVPQLSNQSTRALQSTCLHALHCTASMVTSHIMAYGPHHGDDSEIWRWSKSCSMYWSDNLYLESCAHEQKTHGLCMQWARSMGVAMMANKKLLLMGCAEWFEAHVSEFFSNFDLFIKLTSCSDA